MEDYESPDGLFDGVEASLKPEAGVLIKKNVHGFPTNKCDLDARGKFLKFKQASSVGVPNWYERQVQGANCCPALSFPRRKVVSSWSKNG